MIISTQQQVLSTSDQARRQKQCETHTLCFQLHQRPEATYGVQVHLLHTHKDVRLHVIILLLLLVLRGKMHVIITCFIFNLEENFVQSFISWVVIDPTEEWDKINIYVLNK